VVERALPNISQSAQDSIRGTVRVNVGVDVDSSGSVQNAELVSGGPSKYFAKQALEAAQRWKFQPPTVAGRNALSRWNLRFDFTSSGTTVVPTEDVP
jgi:TonB family protein